MKIFFSGPRKPPFSRASTRSDPAAQSAPAFIVYLLSTVVIRKIVLTEQDKMVPFWTECGLSEQQAKIIFQYTVHGSYMVNKAFHFQRTDEWYHMTCALFTFVTSGYRALYKRKREISRCLAQEYGMRENTIETYKVQCTLE